MEAVTVVWNGVRVEAAAPSSVAEWEPEMAAATVRATERAAGATRRFGDRASGPAEVVARLLLRAEGLASSAIEGLQATAADVAFAEASGAEPRGDDRGVAAWVADNLAVVEQALATPGPLLVASLLEWHARLMRHSPNIADHHVGAWRDVLGWVGGPNPRLAAHVAAPADAIPALMEDLVAFVNRTEIDPVAQAAIAHAQFETIHPFADGNGRIGRVLVGWILKNRLDVTIPPPVSLRIARDIGGYLSGLALFRGDTVEPWVRWFAEAVERSAEDSCIVMEAVADMQDTWRGRTSDLRSDSAGRRLIEVLPSLPVLSAYTAAAALGVSDQAARTGLEALAKRGILNELPPRSVTTGRPTRWWAAERFLDLLGRAR